MSSSISWIQHPTMDVGVPLACVHPTSLNYVLFHQKKKKKKYTPDEMVFKALN